MPIVCHMCFSLVNLQIQAGLSFALIIIYNCSDQVLATRERRQAKTREKAAASVRESQTRDTWKSAAKETAKNITSQLSRTFSKTTSKRQQDVSSKTSNQPKPGSDAALGNSKNKKKDKGNLTKMLHEIDENPESHDGFNVEIGDKKLKKKATPPLHTQSQMFRYAYGQIEKEKALQEQNENLTLSGVLSISGDLEIRKRPPIEIVFKDLTITLKGKNKHLMRCVTGKLHPGNVSAVMGPSGAGKTTFLSAVLGKSPGCNVHGTVLVNGKNEPIQAFKKIIGFVPQDDIVHGNLTVEENLWFSARCR